MSSNEIEAEQVYRFVVEEGFIRSNTKTPHHSLIKGSIIKAIKRGDYSTSQILKAAKRITRESIKYHLSGKELNTKKVFRSIHKSN
jgi:DNA repair protein RecO (recombination protein O)